MDKHSEEKDFIFGYVLNEDDDLPEDFDLEDFGEGGLPVAFADGAVDGIYLFHTRQKKPDDLLRARVALVITAIGTKDYNGAYDKLKGILEERRTIQFHEVIKGYIRDLLENHNADPIPFFEFGRSLLRDADPEMVKAGLVILSFFGKQLPEDTRDMIRMLARSEEMAYFALMAMGGWENRNHEIMEAAQELQGWGRIHAIYCLDEIDQEMVHWLLTEGYKNDIMTEYVALKIALLVDLPYQFRQELSDLEFEGASKIMDALMTKNLPMPSIENYPDFLGLMEAYETCRLKRKINKK